MKWPSDSAGKKKMAVAIAVGALLIVYGLKVGVINPLNNRIERLSLKMETTESNQSAARRYLQDLAPRRMEQRHAITRLAEQLASVDFVLVPSLGNYELPAQQQLQRWIQAAGIQDTPQFRGRNVQPLRWPSGRKEPPLLAAFSASVSFRADLESTLRFLHIMELENPACGITSLNIAAQPNAPAMHQVSLDIEWPVWAEDTAYERVSLAVSNALGHLEGALP